MYIKLQFIFLINFFAIGCTFQKKTQPEANNLKTSFVSLNISENLIWQKLIPKVTTKDQVIKLLGKPKFIDRQSTGEDWYFESDYGFGYGLVSFPVSGLLTEHIQYIKIPEWK